MSSWSTVGALGTARDGYGIIPLSGTKALIIGGASSFPNFTATCEIFDHGSDTWSPTGSMSRANGEGLYITLNSGIILAVGGLETGLIYSSVCELYDPVAGTWSTTGSLHNPRGDHGAIWKLPSGKILVAGGSSTIGSTPLSTCEIYDPNTGLWTFAASLYTTVTNMAFSTLGDGRPMWAGGWVGPTGTTLTNRTYTYDEGSNTWIRQGDLPSNLACQNTRTAITLVNGDVFEFGGYTASGVAQTVAYIYNQVANIWSSSSAAPLALTESTLALLGTSKVFQYAVRFGAQTQTYDYTNDTWTPGPATAGESSGQSYSNNGIVFNDGKILSTGGQNGSGIAVTTTQIFSGVPNMGINFVHRDVAQANETTSGHIWTITSTGTGNLLVACLQSYLGTNQTVSSVVDNAGNTYVQVPGAFTGLTGNGNVINDMWYAKNSIAGATTLTVTMGGSSHQVGLEFFEFSGVDTSSPLQVGNSGGFVNHASPVSAGTVTPSQTGELLVSGAMSSDNSFTGLTGWTDFLNDTSVEVVASAYLINPALSLQDASYTTASTISGAGAIAAFKAAPTGPTAAQKASTFLVI